MLNISITELKAVAKIRGIKGHESMSEDGHELLSALKASELSKESKKNFYDTEAKKILLKQG